MGANFCKIEDSNLDENEKNLSNIPLSVSKFEDEIEPKDRYKSYSEIKIIQFSLDQILSNEIIKNSVWKEEFSNTIKLVNTFGKEIEQYLPSITPTTNSKFSQKSVNKSFFDSEDNEQILKKRLQILNNGKNYTFNGIPNIFLEGDLSILCNVDFQDLFSFELNKKIEKFNYMKEPYSFIREKLFDKNFIFR